MIEMHYFKRIFVLDIYGNFGTQECLKCLFKVRTKMVIFIE